VISEGSCDTEESNAERSASITGIHYILQMFRKHRFYIVIMFHIVTVFYCIFDQINADLVSIKSY